MAAGEATAVVAAVEELSFVVGDTVVIGVNENQLRDLQEDYGGVADSMIKVSMVGQRELMDTHLIIIIMDISMAHNHWQELGHNASYKKLQKNV